jgi:elongation factor 2
MGWAFTCTTFAGIYAQKFCIDGKRLQERFWGDNYFDVGRKAWIKEPSSKEHKRAFVAFIMDPIIKMTNVILAGDMNVANRMFTTVGITLT